jgi:predicted RNA-binding protein
MGKAFENIEEEIRKEKAESLGRAGERLEQILQELRIIRQELLERTATGFRSDPAVSPHVLAEVNEKVMAYARMRSRAWQLRHYLVVQREAVGLWRHEDVDRLYPIPPPFSLPPVNQNGERR